MAKKAFITGGDILYMPMIELMCKTLIPFVDQDTDIIVYTFNCDYHIEGIECNRIYIPKIDFEQKSKYIDLTKVDKSLYWAKFYATIDALSKYEYVSWIDGDAFVTENINDIWEYCDIVKNSPHPYFMRYYHETLKFWVLYKGVRIESYYGSEAGDFFDVKVNPYNILMAAGFYLANNKHVNFFQKVIELWYKSLTGECYAFADRNAFSEERLLNIKFWKNKYKNSLPYTWINQDSNINIQPLMTDKIVSLMNRGFDIMYNTKTLKPIMVHGPNPLLISKNYENLKKSHNSYIQKSNKLMIVAHPDDELIFGGYDLLKEKGWKVVCLTNSNNPIRKREFNLVMHSLEVSEHKMYDLSDNFNEDLNLVLLKNYIILELSKNRWDKIVTHNSIGEYGHPHHHQVHNIVKSIIGENNLWVFDKKSEKIEKELLDVKNDLLKIYQSEKDIIEQIRGNIGNWMKDSDMTTNYIEHGISVPYLGSSKLNEEYVKCSNK